MMILRRMGKRPCLFGRPVQPARCFLKNTGYMLSRLRLLLAYKELRRAHAGQHQCEQILQTINKGRSVKYVLYHLQKVASYWKIEELESCICQIFTLQLHIRRGTRRRPIWDPLFVCIVGRGRRGDSQSALLTAPL